MNKGDQNAGGTSSKNRIQKAEARTGQAEARTEQAETRTEQAETRTEQARTRTEQAETRTERAETRTEQAKTRTEQAESHLEQVETVLERVLLHRPTSLQNRPALIQSASTGEDAANPASLLATLTGRQREILQLIAEGQNTKSIAARLQISPKTVEYHRIKLMDALNVHDVPGLVRLAMRLGIIPLDT